MIKDLIEKNRSYRRFQQDTVIELETLRGEASDIDTKTVIMTDESQEPTEVQDQQQ